MAGRWLVGTFTPRLSPLTIELNINKGRSLLAWPQLDENIPAPPPPPLHRQLSPTDACVQISVDLPLPLFVCLLCVGSHAEWLQQAGTHR